MKRFLVVILTSMLAACSALPGASTNAPTASPVVIVQTVLVTAEPSQAPAAPTAQAPAVIPSPQVIVVTATPSTGDTAVAPVTQAPTALAADATAPLPDNAGGGIFTNMTRSGDKLSLRCQPDSLTFNVSTSNPYAVGVDLYYRIQDRLSTSISNWSLGGSMESDKHGNFTIVFPASRVDPDLRSHRAWFDYQFVAVNKVADALGRSAKISKQVTFTIDCTD
ncbi:MAG TPA: hypothetical protein VFH29_02395 [Anaerolineales bacterium]|nr:hypothetical protein [Anaerolineales bacterium]